LEIQRNYTIIDRKQAWELKCIVCNERYQLNKPTKGEDVHGGNILHLLDHAASHPLPQEDGEPTLDEVEVIPSPPISQVSLSPTNHNSSAPTLKYPNTYMVEMTANITKVSAFRDPTFEDYRKVQKVNDTQYRVVVRAANGKHAQLMGTRLIQKALDAK
jgi:hypothetical protein